ncbi:MAG: V-type ATP synthase subunit F [Candidatus Kariarchaeaceae archaeon]
MSSENISSSSVPDTIVSITDSLTALGLRLTGISKSYEGETKEETENLIKEVIKDPSVAVVIITQPVAQLNYSLIQFLSSTRNFPIFVEIPDIHGHQEGKQDRIRELIRQAVGIDLQA